MKPSTLEWIEKAESDYQVALSLSRRRKMTFHDHACFHAQQSAEKCLKARLEEADLIPPKTHDLRKLLKLILPQEPLWAALLQPLSALRYPGHTANADDVKQAIKHARAVREQVRLGFGLQV